MKEPTEKDLEDAIQQADYSGDQGWTVDDFKVTALGELSLARIRKFEDWGAWIDVDPSDFEGMSVDERLAELASFRGPQWAERAKGWLKTGVPPIVVIEAPSVVDYELHEQIGDGRGRINFALAMGLKKLPVVRMKWKHKLPEAPRDNPAPAPRSTRKNPMGSPNYTDLDVPASGVTDLRVVAKLFLECASICWGEEVQAYLLKTDSKGVQRLKVEQVDGRRDTGTLAALIVDAKPRVVRGRLNLAPHYTLQIGTALYSEPTEEACRVLMHEAIHIGIFNHGEDFRRVADRVGAPYSETALRKGTEPVFIVQRRLDSERRYSNWLECTSMSIAKKAAKEDQDARRAAGQPSCNYRVTY